MVVSLSIFVHISGQNRELFSNEKGSKIFIVSELSRNRNAIIYSQDVINQNFL